MVSVMHRPRVFYLRIKLRVLPYLDINLYQIDTTRENLPLNFVFFRVIIGVRYIGHVYRDSDLPRDSKLEF